MKKLLIALAAVMVTVASYGQGAVTFNNKVGQAPNAPVTRAGGGGAGAGVTAQLLQVVAGGTLIPLTPTTTFKTSSAAAMFYVNGVDVIVPGTAPGDTVTLRMRAFDTSAGSYDAAANAALGRGESNDISVKLGGGTLPPANLVGLQGFNLVVTPEPSTIALGLIGAAALLFRRRK